MMKLKKYLPKRKRIKSIIDSILDLVSKSYNMFTHIVWRTGKMYKQWS